MTTNPPFVPTAASEAAHAFLAPSAAARWVACPGSALMEWRYPEAGDKEAAEDGTAAHWVFQQLWDGWAAEVLLQDRAPNGRAITLEMCDAAQVLVDDVNAVLREHGLSKTAVVIEQRVAIPRVHPSANWGTPDVRLWVVWPDGRAVLFVWDFKYGHKVVDAFENWQLIDYAAGILDEARPWGLSDENIRVVLRVVQPRSYHRDGPVREWRTTAVGLRDYIFRLSMSADEAMQAQPECRPQPSACENCTARHACEALQRATYRGMDLAAQAQASDLTPAALGLELRYLTDAADLMKARLTGLMAQAEGLRAQGVPLPHWRAEPTAAREKWTVSDREAIVAGSLLGLDLAKPPEAVTPTQARQLAQRQGVDASLLGVYSARASGGLKLVPDDGSEARKVFANPV
jgi:hypothetical protein